MRFMAVTTVWQATGWLSQYDADRRGPLPADEVDKE